MLTVMPIVVVPCLVGGYWLPRCAGQCSRGKVGVKQTAVDSDGGGTKTRGSYWTKASRAGQSYYYRWQTPGSDPLQVKDSTLVLPKEAVLRTEEQVELTAFEEGFAEAERMDALRTTLAPAHLNLASPWTKAVHGDRAYYWKESKEKTFFPDRQATVWFKGQQIGVFGVVHPEVLKAFDIVYPCSALEINIEPFCYDQFGNSLV